MHREPTGNPGDVGNLEMIGGHEDSWLDKIPASIGGGTQSPTHTAKVRVEGWSLKSHPVITKVIKGGVWICCRQFPATRFSGNEELSPA